jgi:hypothetical protein
MSDDEIPERKGAPVRVRTAWVGRHHPVEAAAVLGAPPTVSAFWLRSREIRVRRAPGYADFMGMADELEQRVTLTGEAAEAYLTVWMEAADAGVGIDANKLAADAVAAQAGDRAAQQRLYPVLHLRSFSRRPMRGLQIRMVRSSRRGRSSRRLACGPAQARAPDRPDSQPRPEATARPGRLGERGCAASQLGRWRA